MSKTFATLALVAAFSLSGCYLAADGRSLEQRIGALETQATMMQESAESERARLVELIGRAEGEIARLELAISEAQEILRRNSADLGVQVDGLAQSISVLRGHLEESRFHHTELQQELELLRTDLEFQLNTVLESMTPAEAGDGSDDDW